MIRWLLLLLAVLCSACGDDDAPSMDAATADAQTDALAPMPDAALDATELDAEPMDVDAGGDAPIAQTDAARELDASDGSTAGADASDANVLVCGPGFVPIGLACVDLDECLTDNGGCDLATLCTNSEGSFSCGECAAGYVGDAINGCIPRLSSLAVNEAQIAPAFDAETFAYATQVGLHDATIRIDVAAAPLDATVTINDLVVTDGHALVALDIGDNAVEVVVTGTNGRTHSYVLTVDRAPTVLRHAYLKASNADGMDRFGHVLAVSGDTLVVGAPGEDSNATGVNGNQGNPFNMSHLGSGAAYVFVRDGNRWTQQAYLKPSNTRANDAFGTSVAIDGDTLVVGAPHQDGAGQQGAQITADGGAVYVFTRSAGTWTQQAYVQANLAGSGDRFGTSVSISGETLVVGAPFEDGDGQGMNPDPSSNAEIDSGAAYVFTRDGVAWTQQAYLKPSNGDPGDGFGTSVVIEGEVLAVGAPNESSAGGGIDPQLDNSAAGSGAVYVFTRASAVWAQTAWLKASNVDAGDRFGAAVALADGQLAVGAPNEASATGAPEDNSAAACGAVYVFAFDGSAWSAAAYLKPGVTELEDRFGESIAIDGELLVVGAPGEDGSGAGVNPEAPFGPDSNGSAQSGAAYVFARDGSAWTQTTYLKSFVADNAIVNFAFGSSVAIDSGNIAIGAVGDSSSDSGINPPMPAPFTTPDTGSVFAFR